MKRSGSTSFILGSFFLVLLFLLSFTNAHAQWAYTYGGTGSDNFQSIKQTSDGGYIMAGATTPLNYTDLWVMKVDKNGIITWQKSYGGAYGDSAKSIQQLQDGGYIVGGSTQSFGDQSFDFWVLRLDSSGAVIWEKAYGEAGDDYLFSIQQTVPDGGYIVAGWTNSFGAGDHDMWLLKLDGNGNIVWQKTYGGTGFDYPADVKQTGDGGFIVAGYTDSFQPGESDTWLLKLNSDGNIAWQKIYGGNAEDWPASISITSDNGYIVAGTTESFGAGLYDLWMLKLGSDGTVIWEKAYGGTDNDYGIATMQASDGGYIVAGLTASFGEGSEDAWIMKLDENGAVTWQKTFGGTGNDYVQSVQETKEGKYIAAGYTFSFASGLTDALFLSLDGNGSIGTGPCLGNSTASIINTTTTIADTNIIPITSTATVISTTATVTDTTVTPARICPPALSLLSPNGGEGLTTDSDWAVTWMAPFLGASSFKATYSLDNGATWKLIGKDITETTTPWTTPLLTKNKTQCLVKVVGYDDKGNKVGVDKSQAPFTIEVLTITDINGGNDCTGGQNCPITWTLADTITPDQLQVSYTLDGGATWKKEQVVPIPAGSTYDWTAPNVNKDKTCKLKLTLKAAETKVATATSGKFSINKP